MLEARHPQLVAAERWATENHALLSRTFERFRETVEWPSLETLQLDFARDDQDIDVHALAFEIPNPLGSVELQRLVLRVRALQYLPAAAPLLAVWFSSLQLAHRRWLSEGEEARLTRGDVLRAADGDETLALQASQLLLRERWAFGGGYGLPEDPDWWADVVSEVRHVRNARGPVDLLAARDEREYPPTVAAPDDPSEDFQPQPPDVPSRWKRLYRWAVEHYLGAVAAGVTVLVVGGLVGLGVSNLPGGSDGGRGPSSGPRGGSTELGTQDMTSPAGQGITEEAGGGGARTYRNPFTLAQTGPSLSPFERVKVACRVHAPTLPSVTPDGNWYRILSSPWNGKYYAPANSFWNGDSPGQTSEIHNTDFDVPECDR
jgi:hypothetical protein